MPHIAIISSSVRTGRKSHRVVLYLQKYIESHQLASVEILDLKEYDFPVFNERFSRQHEPTDKMKDFRDRIIQADGVIIVTPEYNGGYPASLKNVVDFLYEEWHRKPVAISTVSGGAFGGSQVITSLQFSLWKIRAWTVPAMFPLPKVQDNYDEEGDPADKEATDKRADHFIQELLWCMEAKAKMDESADKS
ncbi:NAD(P)H-dependent oxidoreductase [Pontibacter sp. JH31]|uniref:NAD(P)H-dependent oxidoreductase n=1 Tax=Pontibacter aquaedesilientis TaxID=2766980 RepID=A0ABR7XDV5_9BACT|nr:NADPH-dependent FMN reductase [Pontibacter aquaedesilientis]MBD1396475.1 NAD(P)H-dependent oxidoreductase [Pontibacter aquaedesilientis]